VSSPARLPLFPLPLVLFPGATLPLHIFEPRYRAMLADCQRGDGRFGIVLSAESEAPRPGLVGCVAELRDVRPLPDGRSHVLVEGAERFAIARIVDTDAAYLTAEIGPWDDAAEPAAHDELRSLDVNTRAAFARVAHAARTIADDADPIPDLPPDPATLSFAIAAVIDLELPTRQRLLESRSAVERLRELHDLLARALPGAETRAAVHVGARRNGHGPHTSAPPA
jgi:Lon protease-like protein